MEYRIPVKIDSLERRRRSAGLLHTVAGLYLLANSIGYLGQRQYQGIATMTPFLLLALASVIYGLRRKKIDPDGHYNTAFRGLQGAAFAILCFTQSGTAVFGLLAWVLLSFLLLTSERAVFRPSELTFSEAGIGVPGGWKPNVLPWAELEGIIVRADFVTLFRNDKKYVQLEVLGALDNATLEGVNAFGRAQIQKSEILTP